MNVRALFDVNMLLALFDVDHVHHRQAIAWWSRHQDAGWASCPLTQNGFARIISQSSYPVPVPTADAVSTLILQIETSDHAFWPGDISIADPAVFDHARILGPKQLTDVYLLALAVKHGGRLVTFDRGIPLAAVRGATPEHLVAL